MSLVADIQPADSACCQSYRGPDPYSIVQIVVESSTRELEVVSGPPGLPVELSPRMVLVETVRRPMRIRVTRTFDP